MESNAQTQIDFILSIETDFRKEMMPIQELVANPVRYKFERSMADILTERAAESRFILAAPAFIP